MSDDFQKKVAEAIANPKNMGEMEGADAVGTVGSPNCGDMVRMWIKFKEENGKKVIDRASFQTFGCETAIAVASLATTYAVDAPDEEAAAVGLASQLSTRWSLPTALAFLAWFVFAPQCLSTIAVTRRETNGWKWPLFMLGYLFALAYIFAGLTYWTAIALGL